VLVIFVKYKHTPQIYANKSIYRIILLEQHSSNEQQVTLLRMCSKGMRTVLA